MLMRRHRPGALSPPQPARSPAARARLSPRAANRFHILMLHAPISRIRAGPGLRSFLGAAEAAPWSTMVNRWYYSDFSGACKATGEKKLQFGNRKGRVGPLPGNREGPPFRRGRRFPLHGYRKFLRRADVDIGSCGGRGVWDAVPFGVPAGGGVGKRTAPGRGCPLLYFSGMISRWPSGSKRTGVISLWVLAAMSSMRSLEG